MDGVRRKYHLECQTLPDSSMMVRIFEYDAQIALDDGSVSGNVLTVTFPKSAVLFLRHNGETPDTMHIRMVTPGGTAEYTVPVVKVQQYSLDDIFTKNLLFFLPFYIFSHEKDFPSYESDKTELQKLEREYIRIKKQLDELQKAGNISEFVKSAICAMTNHVLELIAQNYENVREGVGQIMGGKILEYEAKDILKDGIKIGRSEGISEGIGIGVGRGREEAMKEAVAATEERAKDMLRDRMEMSLVERYTHLSMPRIQELARGLGML